MPIFINKKIGETPLQSIQRIKSKDSKYKKIKMGYAGRLDPMAEGLLVILTGEECKRREEFQRMDKTYEFEILFGIATDTYDLLGKIITVDKYEIDQEKINDVIRKHKGNLLQEYPPFSSPLVKGKPLFWWAREQKLGEIKIPTKKINIDSIDLVEESKISSLDLLKHVHEKIKKVSGDFRQQDILQMWDQYLENKTISFPILKFEIKCSSGTYVRSIVNSISRDLKCPALTFSIKRTRVGNYKL